MMKNLQHFLVVSIAGVSLIFSACLKPVDAKSSTKSYLDSSFSCDLQSTGAASEAGSQAAYKCAYDALGQAASLSGGVGFAQEVKELIEGVDDLKTVVAGSYQIVQDLSEFFENGGQPSDGMLGNAIDTLDAEKRLDSDTKKSAIYRCISGNYNTMKKFYKAFNAAQQADVDRQISSNELQRFISLATDFSELLYSGSSATTNGFVDSLGGCAEWMNNDPKFKVAFKEGMDAMKKVMAPIKTLRVLAQCGVALGKGGYILANNSACLVEDINNYYQGKEALEKQKENYVNNPPMESDQSDNKVDGSDSSGDSNYVASDNRCMTVYGIWLGKQSFFSYFTRSSACADQCAGAAGKETYYENSRKIFPAELDHEYCLMNAKVGSSRINVELCASYCCGQDNSCSSAAVQKAGYN